MVKLGSFARSIGKNLASLVVGASTLIGALDAKSEELIPCNSVTNVAPFIASRSAHYVCPNVKFNNRASNEKITLLYKFHNISDNKDYIIGGLTIPAGSTNTVFDESYLYGNKTFPPAIGLATGQVATNGLNGTSEWICTVDFNRNGFSFYKGVSSGNLYFERGEVFPIDRVVINGVPGMPADKISTVSITDGISLIGYPDDFPTNGIPDYFEAKYNLPMNTTTNSNFDGDSQTDFQEWVAGTDPTNAASYFGVKSFDNGTNTFALNIGNTLEGRVYGVKATTNLADSASWTNAIPEVAGNGTNTLYITKDPMKQQEFYKPYVNLSTNEVVNP